MDPATIVGTTSAILSFIQFSGKVISVAYKVYDSSDGAIDDNRKLEEAVNDVHTRLRSLRPTEQNSGFPDAQAGASTAKTDAEKSLLRTASQCETLGNEILEILNKTTAKVVQVNKTQSASSLRSRLKRFRKDAIDDSHRPGKPTLVEAIRASIQTVWQKDKIGVLRQQWGFCVSQLNMDLQRLDAGGKHDVLCAAFQKNSEQIGEIGDLLKLLVEHRIPQLESLQAFLEDLKEADTLPRLEKTNTEYILKALEFEGMNARGRQIEDPVGDTFKWFLDLDAVPSGHPELKTSFKKWLNNGTGVYHVTGKPGSGKSTMMKLIDNATVTKQQLEGWASQTGERLIMARFYTWKAANANPLQNQEEGMTRTLLHQILTAAPELTRAVFANRPCWKPQEFRLINIMPRSQGISAIPGFEPREILAALESLFSLQGYRFFLLIDGMDEFKEAHNHRDIAQRVLRWSSLSLGRVKICVSSREENAFTGNFSPEQRLQLHIVTKNDARKLVEARLEEHNYFIKASYYDRQRLVDKIVDRAEGVFLWVVLTIQELKILMDDRQSFRMLLQEVDRFPGEMENFLREILSRIPNAYKEESKAIFSVATTGLAVPLGHLSLFHYSMLRRCIETDDPDTGSSLSHMSLDDALLQMREFSARLPSMCKGLFETAPGQEFRILYGDMSAEDKKSTIQCSHRSVFEFLQDSFNNPAAVDFEPSSKARSISLAVRSMIEVMKAIPWDEGDEMRKRTHEVYLRQVLVFFEFEISSDPRLGDSIFPLFKELDAILLRKQRAISTTTPFNSMTSEDIRLDPEPLSVFSIAFQADLRHYVDWASTNYPSLFLTPEAKPYVVGEYNDQQFTRVPTRPYGLPVRCLTEAHWLSIDEPVLPHHSVSSSYFQLQRGSMWIRTLLWFILDCREINITYNELCEDFEEALAAGAESRIRFEWWSQAEFPTPHHRSNRAADLARTSHSSLDEMESDPGKVPFRPEIPFGKDFGVSIRVGDDQEPEVIRGPSRHEPERRGEVNTRLIRFFVGHFQKPCGVVTLKDIAEVLLEPNEKRCYIEATDVEGRKSWREEELAHRRRCLRAVDTALARVGSLPPTDTQSDSRAPKGTIEGGQDADAVEDGDQQSQPSCLSPRNYFHGWQTAIISILAILLALLCKLAVPQTWWK